MWWVRPGAPIFPSTCQIYLVSGMGLPCAEVAVLAEANNFPSAMSAC